MLRDSEWGVVAAAAAVVKKHSNHKNSQQLGTR